MRIVTKEMHKTGFFEALLLNDCKRSPHSALENHMMKREHKPKPDLVTTAVSESKKTRPGMHSSNFDRPAAPEDDKQI
jgi:hypothetical protein